MLSYIQGILTEKNPTYAVIDCSGVGFLLFISVNTYASLPELNQKCKLHTHLTIKSEATTPVGLVMYGFSNVEERSIFLELISVSGIGSNTARLILSSLTTTDVISAISNGDVHTFRNVKGIGEKTAQRIIIDLRDRISKIPHSKEFFLPQHNNIQNEALSALIMLGFNKNTADKVVDKVIKNQGINISLEEMVKQALKLL